MVYCFFINKGFEGVDHFVQESRKMSGVFVISKSTKGKLLVNSSGEPVLTQNIINLLREC